MGLDMYLYRMPRYKNTTAEEVMLIDSWLNYLDSDKEYSFREWSGYSESELPSKEVIDFYKSFYHVTYHDWDTDKKYPDNSIYDNVGYWRKANQIHNWFVKNVQGVDDCGYYKCHKDTLEELLDICREVKSSSYLIPGQVFNGCTYCNGERIEEYAQGFVIEDYSVAEELLPCKSGFFFGSTGYDEYYLADIEYTIDVLEKVLSETDFKKEMICYHSSW